MTKPQRDLFTALDITEPKKIIEINHPAAALSYAQLAAGLDHLSPHN